MQVQPNSTIYLLAGVPIDKGYNYTLYFNDRASQTAYMQTMRLNNGTFTGQQYTRVEKGRLRVQVCADDVINCNYIMFKNNGTVTGGTRYADKWFYAFAHVQYVNEQCCDVIFEIDDIQTWMFDYEFNECFVEREHSATDVAGDNLQPEPVDTGELVAQKETILSMGKYMLAGIITNVPLHNNVTDQYGTHKVITLEINGVNYDYEWYKSYYGIEQNTVYDTTTGVVNGLHIYTGIILSNDDYDDYFKYRIAGSGYTPSPQNPDQLTYNINLPIDTGSGTHPLFTIGRLLNAIQKGEVVKYGSQSISAENIVSVYQYPCELNASTYETSIWTYFHPYDKKGCALKTFELDAPTGFSYRLSQAYTPKNQKLLTAPYIKLYLTSLTGTTGEFRYEFFDKVGNKINLFGIGNFVAEPNAILTPRKYKGKDIDYDSSLPSSPYVKPFYAGNALVEWLQTSQTNFMLGAIGSVLSMGVGSVSGNPLALLSGVTGLSNSIGGYIDKSSTPPNTYYAPQQSILSTQTNRIGFAAYELAVTPEYARKIDSFFTKYGYAVNEVKVPNLQRGSTKRQNWNYLKVKNCMLHGILPSDVEDHLERIYEKGITFWNYNVTVGDYSIANPIVTPSTP